MLEVKSEKLAWINDFIPGRTGHSISIFNMNTHSEELLVKSWPNCVHLWIGSRNDPDIWVAKPVYVLFYYTMHAYSTSRNVLRICKKLSLEHYPSPFLHSMIICLSVCQFVSEADRQTDRQTDRQSLWIGVM